MGFLRISNHIAVSSCFDLTRAFAYALAHLPAIKALPKGSAILRAVYSRSTKSAAGLASFATTELEYSTEVDAYSEEAGGDKGLDAVLGRKDVQIIVVSMPINSQPEMVLKCLAAGKQLRAFNGL